MKNSYLVALLIAVVGGIMFWYQMTAAQCPVPLSYRLGTVDPAFSIDQEQVLAYASRAEAVWEAQVGRDLFSYDEDAPLSIEFIYDDRQANADSEAMQRVDLDDKRERSELLQATLEELQTKYTNLSRAHDQQVTVYEKRLGEYNAEVNKYNDQGGAPPEVFERLEQERRELSSKVQELNDLSSELETVARKINELAEQGNALVELYNEEVTEYNQEFGFAREFTQGDYQGDRIHVYKFSSDTEVITVLAHEFGHALGLDHVEGTSSLMYYLLENTAEVPTLSSFDLASYETVCGQGESFQQKIRLMIRKILTIF